MALIYCPNCKNKISEFSKVCSHCNQEVPQNNHEYVDKNPRKNVFSEDNKKPKKWLVILLCVLAAPAGLLIGVINDKIKRDNHKEQIETYENYSNKSSEQQTQGNSEQLNTCSICNRSFSGKGYEEVSEGVWEPCQEPYQCFICSKSCGLKQTRKMNNLINESSNSYENNSNSYQTGSDGRVYENNACSLCKGTGIESGRNVANGETEGRTCPMCEGKGVRSY